MPVRRLDRPRDQEAGQGPAVASGPGAPVGGALPGPGGRTVARDPGPSRGRRPGLERPARHAPRPVPADCGRPVLDHRAALHRAAPVRAPAQRHRRVGRVAAATEGSTPAPPAVLRRRRGRWRLASTRLPVPAPACWDRPAGSGRALRSRVERARTRVNGGHVPRQVFFFDPPERFVAGTVGQPGERAFFLQARTGGRVVSVALEKVQVAALADRLEELLAEVRRRGADVGAPSTGEAGGELGETEDTGPLDQPILEEFRVGTMALAWDGSSDRVVVEAQAQTDDPDAEPVEPLTDDDTDPEHVRACL